jgi:chloramphenicol 3-O phosphotransferase
LASRTRVIILNGVSSVGKNSTARSFQTISAKPFMHGAMDTFLGILPAAMLDHPDGLTFEDEGKPSVVIRGGPVVERAMRHAIAALAAFRCAGDP